MQKKIVISNTEARYAIPVQWSGNFHPQAGTKFALHANKKGNTLAELQIMIVHGMDVQDGTTAIINSEPILRQYAFDLEAADKEAPTELNFHDMMLVLLAETLATQGSWSGEVRDNIIHLTCLGGNIEGLNALRFQIKPTGEFTYWMQKMKKKKDEDK